MGKSPENLKEARRLHKTGASLAEIGRLFEIHYSTARQWVHPEFYEKEKKRIADVNRRHRMPPTDHQREVAMARYHERYYGGDWFRKKMVRFRKKHGAECQDHFRQKGRQMVIGHADRGAPLYTAQMTLITGMTREAFTERFKEGTINFILPLEAFNLTYPAHMVCALHHSNVTTEAALVLAPDKWPDTIEGLACNDDPETVHAAAAIISRMASAWKSLHHMPLAKAG